MNQKKRNGKRSALAGLLVALLAVGIGLFADFNVYRKGSKENNNVKEGLIFTITAFDGASESELFIQSLGHAWVALDNQSDHSVYLSGCEIKPGEIRTISVWGISGHFGVAYNLEPAFAGQFGRYVGSQSVSINLDESKLAVIENYITRNDCWQFVKNCSYWSVHLWNEVADETMQIKTPTLLYTPVRLKKALSEFSNVETDKDYTRAGSAFFFVDGERTELELCE